MGTELETLLAGFRPLRYQHYHIHGKHRSYERLRIQLNSRGMGRLPAYCKISIRTDLRSMDAKKLLGFRVWLLSNSKFIKCRSIHLFTSNVAVRNVFCYQVFAPLIKSHLVLFSTSAMTIVSDGTILLLTLAKTLHLKREGKALGIKTPLATLLLRDGEYSVYLIFSNLNLLVHRLNILHVSLP